MNTQTTEKHYGIIKCHYYYGGSFNVPEDHYLDLVFDSMVEAKAAARRLRAEERKSRLRGRNPDLIRLLHNEYAVPSFEAKYLHPTWYASIVCAINASRPESGDTGVARLQQV